MSFTGKPGTADSQPSQLVPMFGAGGTKRSKSLTGVLTSSGLLSTIRTFIFTQISVTAYRAVNRGISFLTDYKLIVLKDSPVSYWRLNDFGPVAFDSVGINNGNITGHVITGLRGASGDGDKAMSFDGADGLIKIGPANFATAYPITLACFVNIISATGKGTFMYTNTGAAGSWGLGQGAGDFDHGGNHLVALNEIVRWVDTGVVLSLGWHQVALVINSSGQPTIYLDGVQVYTDTVVQSSVATTQVSIGSNGFSRFFAGLIDEVAFYNYALTSAQILTQYKASTPRGKFLTTIRTSS